MQIGKIQSVNFGSKSQPKETGGVGKAVASYFVPGLGEFIDGRNKSGAFFLASRLGVGIAGTALSLNVSNDFFKNASKALANNEFIAPTIKKNKTIGLIAIGVASMALTIANVVNAYKGKKTPKAEQTK